MSSSREVVSAAQTLLDLFFNWELANFRDFYAKYAKVTEALAFQAYCTSFAPYEDILSRKLALDTHPIASYVRLGAGVYNRHSWYYHPQETARQTRVPHERAWASPSSTKFINTRLGNKIFDKSKYQEELWALLDNYWLCPQHMLTMPVMLPLAVPMPVPNFVDYTGAASHSYYYNANDLADHMDTLRGRLSVGTGRMSNRHNMYKIHNLYHDLLGYSPAAKTMHAQALAYEASLGANQLSIVSRSPVSIDIIPPKYYRVTQQSCMGVAVESTQDWTDRMQVVLQAQSNLIDLIAPLFREYALMWSAVRGYFHNEVTCRSNVSALTELLVDYAASPGLPEVNISRLSTKVMVHSSRGTFAVALVKEQLLKCAQLAKALSLALDGVL